MKKIFFPIVLMISFCSHAQQKLPVIKANSNKATIRLEHGLTKGWNIEPAEKLDVFVTPKLTGIERICFKSDADSILITLKPGEKTDFIVLLNGKDSCLTRIQSPESKNFSGIYPEIHDTIPLTINEHNTIFVESILNKADTLQLNFDTGTSDLMLKNEVIKHKITSPLKLYNTLYNLQIGKRNYTSAIYPVELSGHGTDGRFGWDLFDGLIVELNYDRKSMIVHSKLPADVLTDKAFTKLNIKYIDNIFLVESTLSQHKVNSKSWFLFDTGYQRTAMLDSDLLRESKFPVDKMEVIKKVIMKGGQGNEVPVITSDLDMLTLGRYKLKHVPVQVQSGNKPLQGLNIHILGNEVLKRFNVVLDFQNNVVYLKPNKLLNDPYAEQKEKGL